ncbi:MAG: trypsin-like peptidase domain-containing protein [Deltaproteobacteria bacterium]|nr:trypsin-like peptidase domain-containing protein [Deltaproteobacteria bacterium]
MRESSRFVPILAILLLLVAGALVFTVIQQRRSNEPPPVSFEPRAITPAQDLGADEKATIAVFQNDAPSVVHITSIQVRRDQLSLNEMEIPAGVGSGFIWDTAGNIVTNFHVIEGASRAQVILSDGTAYSAEIVGQAPDKDLAVLRISAPPSKLRPLAIGTSTNLLVGQKVLAIGNPFGLDQTLTTGVISGLGREIKSVTQRPIHDVIQTDAPINPGNSGGPLLDSAGRLIGVNTAIYSPSGGSNGIGFAVPVDTINRIVPQLIQYGKIARPGLGVNIAADQLVAQLNPKVEGVLILGVVPGGAAERAGVVSTQPGANGVWKLGDLIVGFDGAQIKKQADLYRALDNHKVGDTVKLTLERDGQKRDVELTLQALDQ